MVLVAWCSSEAALESHHECVLLQVGTHTPTGLVPQVLRTASYLSRLLVSISGTALLPVPFLKCTPNNYEMTQTTHNRNR